MGLGMASEHFLCFVSGDFDLKFCSKLRRRNILSKFQYFPVPRVGNLAKTLQTSNNHMLHLCSYSPRPPPSLLRPNTYTCIRRGEVKVGGSNSSLPSSLLSQPFIPEAPYTQSQARNCPNRVTNLVTLLLLGSDSGFQHLVMYLNGVLKKKQQQQQEHTTTYPTVVIDMNAHQKPSQVPLENEEGKFSEFLLAS